MKAVKKMGQFPDTFEPSIYTSRPLFCLTRLDGNMALAAKLFFSNGSARTRVQKRRTFIDKPNDNTIKRLLVFVPIELGTRNQRKKETLVGLFPTSLHAGVKAARFGHNIEIKRRLSFFFFVLSEGV